MGHQDRGEWATRGEKVGAWLRMDWPTTCLIKKIVIYDRNNLADYTQEVLLKFSDGKAIRVGDILNNGEGREIMLEDWIVTNSKAANVGLSEVEVYGVAASQ